MSKLMKRLAPFGVMGIVFIVPLTSAVSALRPGAMIGRIVTIILIKLNF